jgi:hypothetical protein
MMPSCSSIASCGARSSRWRAPSSSAYAPCRSPCRACVRRHRARHRRARRRGRRSNGVDLGPTQACSTGRGGDPGRAPRATTVAPPAAAAVVASVVPAVTPHAIAARAIPPEPVRPWRRARRTCRGAVRLRRCRRGADGRGADDRARGAGRARQGRRPAPGGLGNQARTRSTTTSARADVSFARLSIVQ